MNKNENENCGREESEGNGESWGGVGSGELGGGVNAEVWGIVLSTVL